MKLAWAVSGAGMGARAVMEANLAGLLRSRLDLVILDRIGPTDSMAEYCGAKAIDLKIITPANLEAELLETQKVHRFDAMGLTFNRLIPQRVIDAFNSRIFNLHLSLLPMFPGFGATRKALVSGLPHAGVTVHFIDAGIDTGPIIAQQKVAIKTADTEATLGRRQFEASVPLLLQTVRLIENSKEARFETPDTDLIRFATEYCRRL
jgi:phosphoribosylglycinamide formyltransferase-1